MREIIYAHFEHVLCGLIFISRLGDVLSTYLVTPKLTLEANPIVKKLGWRFAIFSIVVCIIPYFNTTAGIIVLVPSLLVSSTNISKIWFIKSMGEAEYANMLLRLVQKSKLSRAIIGVLVSSALMFLLGFVLWFLSPDPEKDWGYWFGLGIICYSFVIALYGSIYFVKLFRKARREFPPIDEGTNLLHRT